ncbi:MAG: tryptophan-rich sensory protein [Chloroflexota bacterium]|jgi:tryptophan-rich sensory protein
MNKDTIRQILIIVAVVATIVVNGLATALPINGQTTGEISDSFDVFFVPAGYVFSIWGVIYLGLVAYAVYQALPAQAGNADLRSIGSLFFLSSLANIAWILLWHYEYVPLSAVVMLVLLVCLIAIYLRLDINRKPVSSGMRWLVHLPFSIYLGWITVATIANVTVLLYDWDWTGLGISAETWTVIMLTIGTVVGGLMSFTRGDIAYSLVLIWAFSGIAIKHSDTSAVATAAWIATAATAVLMLVGAYYHRRRQSEPVPVV